MVVRRLLVLAVLGAALLLVAALVGVLALSGSPSEPASTGPTLVRHPEPPPRPELPAPVAEQPAPAAPLVPPHIPGVPPVGPNVIVARVLDDETGAPISQFTVKAVPHDGRPALPRLGDTPGRPEPVHAVAGIFRLERGKGRWDVVVQAAGYLPAELTDVVLPRPNVTPLELRVSHGPSITGLVFDDNNLGVKDVPVFLAVEKQATSDPPPAVTLARTDDEGRFRFSPLPPGTYTVTALEPNGDDRMNSIALDRGTTEISLYVAPRHQVVAAVRDADGRPVRDAEVELRSTAGIATERTNAAGQAQLRFVKAGSYEVHITREGYADLHDTLELKGPSGEEVHWYTLQDAP